MDLVVFGRQFSVTAHCHTVKSTEKFSQAWQPRNDSSKRSRAKTYQHRAALSAVATPEVARDREQTPTERVEATIPEDIANSVVRLEARNPAAPGGRTAVYLLGMSHVSKKSVQAVRTLVAAVRPEVVLVEVCKDRIGLMLNPDGPRDLQLWNSRDIFVSGLPIEEGWPAEKDILSVIETRPNQAFTTPDVEADCVRLLATGLFRNVRPSFKRPTNLDAPQFVKVRGDRMATVPPLGPVEFIVSPRILPTPTSFSVRVDSSLSNAGIDLPLKDIQQIEETLLAHFSADSKEESASPSSSEVAASSDGNSEQQSDQGEETNPDKAHKGPKKISSLGALLRTRQSLLKLLSPIIRQDFDVSLRGVETGEIEAVIKAKQGEGFTSGLEGSAEGGEGQGIETFKPQRGPLQVSSNLKVPNIAKVLQREGEHAGNYVLSVRAQPTGNSWRSWTRQEMADAENIADDVERGGFGSKFADLLSQTYAKLQNAAGERVGVKPGAAWREALEAASEHGGIQVHLGDMPADLASRNLAAGIWKGLSTRLTAAAVIAAAASTASVAHLLPQGTGPWAAGGVASAVGFAAIPFLAPLLEVLLFSRKSPEQIEETVQIKESLQARGTEMLRLPGEDAITRWPNAKENIIDARDSFMARTLYAAATGSGASPAFVLDTSEGRNAWNYVMPSRAPDGCSTKGAGAGEYEPLKGCQAVVGIVGSAHVGGIVREWEAASDQQKLSELLGK